MIGGKARMDAYEDRDKGPSHADYRTNGPQTRWPNVAHEADHTAGLESAPCLSPCAGAAAS